MSGDGYTDGGAGSPMNVSLKPELARFIDDQVKLGKYDSAEDVINAAVARLQTDRELSEQDINELRTHLDGAIAEADRREFIEFTAEDVIAERRAIRAR